jgi:hypothetical protein
MNAHIVFGLFALYVALISLCLVLVGQQDSILALMRYLWGRSRGYALYFLANVALPLLVCILCLGWGVSRYDGQLASDSSSLQLQLNVGRDRNYRPILGTERVTDTLGVVYGA